MKTETKAIVASIAVIALMLTMVSGATYSWLTDIDQSTVTVNTGVVKYDTTFYLDDSPDPVEGNTISIDGLVANKSHTIKVGIDNKSTIDTVYRIYAKYDISGPGAAYDYANVCIPLDGHDNYLSNGSKTGEKTIVLKGWDALEAADSPETNFEFELKTSPNYGSFYDKDYDSYKLPDGSEYDTDTDGDGTVDWSGEEARSISITIVVEAYQVPIFTSESDTCVVTVPEFGVVNATLSLTYSGASTTVPLSIKNLDEYIGKTLTIEMTSDLLGFHLTLKVEGVDANSIEGDPIVALDIILPAGVVQVDIGMDLIYHFEGGTTNVAVPLNRECDGVVKLSSTGTTIDFRFTSTGTVK